jgi:hypothetical protein
MKIIRFVTEAEDLRGLGKPTPIKKLIPEWYKQAESTFVDPNSPHHEEQSGLKKCMPFMDTMIAGYALTIPVDIYVTRDGDGNPRFSWNGPEKLGGFISERPKQLGETMPRPPGHYPNHLAFAGFWGWKTPRGWSTLVVQPLNRHDLPFTITSGIIDSDKFNAAGNIPFFLKEGFEGTIYAGTPYAQIIPIKRSSWMMVDDTDGLIDKVVIQASLVRKNDDKTPYKKFAWAKKDFS